MDVRRPLSTAVLLSLLASLLALVPAGVAGAQATTTVFINEIHYDNVGTDAGEGVEVAGPAGTDLSGWTVVPYNGNNGQSYSPIGTLSGTIPNQSNGYGTVFVAISGLQNGAPDGLALVNGTTVVQFLSYEGAFAVTDGPASGMTSTDIGVQQDPAPPIGDTLQLIGTGQTYEDFTWAGPRDDSPGAINADQTFLASGENAPPTVTSTPGTLDLETGESGSAAIEAADADGTVVSLAASDPDPLPAGITFTATDADSGVLSVDDTVAAGTYTITYTATDDEGGTGTGTTTVTVTAPLERTPISTVQGSGSASPMVGQDVKVEGIVTSLFESRDVIDAVFIQEAIPSDDDPETSEGIYIFCRVYCANEVPGIAVGDAVTVEGEVDEFQGMTQLAVNTSAGSITINSSGNDLPAATPIELPADGSTTAEDTVEHVESMVVTFPQTLAVSEYFDQARFGHLRLVLGERQEQFTQNHEPDEAGYTAYLHDLATRQIFLDDDNNDQNDPTTGPEDDEPYYYPTPGLSTDNFFRGGDTIDDLTAVMHWSWPGANNNTWRLRPIQGTEYTFDRVTERPAQPDDVGGDLRVASFNVLNYFTTIDETSSNSTGPCGPSGTMDCRGADSLAEFERQQDKIVAAMVEIDADVIGLIEIENNEQAVQNLVDALNEAIGDDAYAQVDTGTIGTDAIKLGLIYRPDAVTPSGPYEVVDETNAPGFDTSRNRPALIQTFSEVASGETFTVAVNHLKSKGSPCGEGDDAPATGAGNCNGTRTEAAEALSAYLTRNDSDNIDPDILIIGDLNSYAMEAPIQTLVEDGYTDLLAIEGQYTYLFDGQLGTLDYALSSESMTPQVTGVTAWNINADEHPLFDYNDTVRDDGEASFERESAALPLYAPDPYRSSDHDPVIVGLSLGEDEPPVNSAPTADAGGPYTVRVGRSIQLDASGSSDPDSDTLTYAWDFDDDGDFDDAAGPSPTFRAPGRPPGVYPVAVQVSDGELTDVDETTVTVRTPGNQNPGPPGQPGPPDRPGRPNPPVGSEGVSVDDRDPSSGNPFAGLGELLGLFDVSTTQSGEVTVTFTQSGRVCLVFQTDSTTTFRCSTEVEFAQDERSLSMPVMGDGVLGLIQADATAARIGGADRIGTAVAVSSSGWDSADHIVLASAGGFADALAGTPLAGQLGAPLLITETDALDPTVLAEIRRLDATGVTILGGTAAISAEVATELADAGLDITRLEGPDRTTTAEAIASALDASSDGLGIVAAGGSFADALAIAPIAAMRGLPIYLTAGDALTSSTLEGMGADGITQVLIVGGTAAVPQAVEVQLEGAGVTVADRLAGGTRYQTATAILGYAADTGTDTTELLIATGENFPDALAAGAYGARTGRAVLLVNGALPLAGQPAEAFLADSAAELLVLMGGDAVLSEELRAALQGNL